MEKIRADLQTSRPDLALATALPDDPCDRVLRGIGGRKMRGVVGATWPIVLCFVVAVAALGLAMRMVPLGVVASTMAAAVFLVPPLWWHIVVRRNAKSMRSGASAGAIGAGIVFMLPFGWALILSRMQGHGTNTEQSGLVIVGMMLFVLWIAAVPAGAMLGALTVALQGRWLPRQR